MASCEYAGLVGGHCGSAVGNPANSQCITIENCDKDIRNHLRSFGAGFADSTVKTEAELLLARAGKSMKSKEYPSRHPYVYTHTSGGAH